LARPRTNATGLSAQSADLAGKRIEILRELFPSLSRLAVIANLDYAASMMEVGEVEAAARKLGVKIEMPEIRRAADIVPTFEALKKGAQALYVCASALVNANISRINILALGAHLPMIHPLREYLASGGFMSYGANNAELFRRSADFVDKMLRGD
jgi:putative ABC transport system substrate-binding protein